jgi:cytochrome c-type biogenesis protein CcmH/NrfG
VSPSTRFDPDALASLESERDFLLRSIADLETEREAGNLDDDRYRTLKDDYTARAAAVLRSIEESQDAAPAPAPVPRKRRLLTGGAVLVFVIVAALALAASTGNRREGQTITGNAQGAESDEVPVADRKAALERQIQEHPDDPAAHIVYARFLIETSDPNAGGAWPPPDAVKAYLKAAQLDPKNPEANAYAGWTLFLATQNSEADPKTTAELVDRALVRLDAAVAANDSYPDGVFFRGMVQLRGKNNPKAAIPDFERYLALVPEGQFHDQVKQLLEQARSAPG